MKKRVLQIALDMAVALVATIFIAVFNKVSFATMVDNMTWMVIVLLTYIIVDDPINIALNCPKMITKPYLVGLGLFSGSLISFETAYFVNNQMYEILFLVLSLVIFIFAIVWVYQNYIDPKFVALEIERAKLNTIKAKIPDITKDQCEKLLQDTMRFRIEGDNIKGDVDLTRPFDNENLSTVNQMIKRNCSPQLIISTKNYIKNLVDKTYLDLE